MTYSSAINVNENSKDFQLELERRIKFAKNSKNRILLNQAKINIFRKYWKFAGSKS